MIQWLFEGVMSTDNVSVEDSGCAKYGEVRADDAPSGMFVRIHSYDDPPEEPVNDWVPTHPAFDELVGKRVRVTVEVLD